VRITPRTTIFFDASVLVAGTHSAQGGSGMLLEACKLRGFAAQTTFLVVLEALRALESNFPPAPMARFYKDLVEIDWDMLPVPSEEVLLKYAALIDAKDLHVLAAAVAGGSDFLLTLDRKRILAAAQAVENARIPIRILTPGDFIGQVYPLHDDYPSLPAWKGSK
jgi:predicted nucleic acid-binding protein